MGNFPRISLLFLLSTAVPPLYSDFVMPFPKVYPVDLGQGNDMSYVIDFFQFHSAPRAFCRVYLIEGPHKDGWSQHPWRVTYQRGGVPLNAILYRTHEQGEGKGVLFHFERRTMLNAQDASALSRLLQTIDYAVNTYRFPVVYGPGGGTSSLFREFDSHFPFQKMKATFALGYSDEGMMTERSPGYRNMDIDNLAKRTDKYCKVPNTRMHVAFNAFILGQTGDPINVNFRKFFKHCKLLLYARPGLPPIKLKGVRRMLDTMQRSEMQVLVPGRSIGAQLVSLQNLAWAYTIGHRKFPDGQMPEEALLKMMDDKISLIRLHVYPERNDKGNLMYFTAFYFRRLTEEQLILRNYLLESLPMLAQVDDWSRLIVLIPERYEDWNPMMEYFRAVNPDGMHKYPFLEARILRGPNGKCDAEREQREFFNMATRSKYAKVLSI